MAELVQRHMESMADEIEEMRRTKLYTMEELRFILKTRKEFEYKINGVSKNVKDFEAYIMYEKVLLKQIHNRRDKSMIAERKSGIEYKILRRIKNLYEIALQRFSSNFSLCLSYFKFCKQSNYINAASVAVQNMIKNCSQDPQVWQVAAAWYAHDRNDLNTALTVLNKGLTLHKDSKLLYTDAIKLELSVLKNNTKEGDNLAQVVCKKIETYVHFICERIKDDAEYWVEILNLLECYSATTTVQNLIIQKLMQQHSEKEFVWHTLAQREKRGLHYSTSNEEAVSGQDPITLCFKKYQEGLTMVCPSSKASLWTLYLDCLVDAQHENTELMKGELHDLLKSALEQASNEKYLTESYYIRWLELVTDEEAANILEKATATLPNSVDLWKLRLRYASMTDSNSKVDKIFEQGVHMLKENSLPLWFMYLRYYSLLSRDRRIEDIYKEGIKQPQQISETLKPKYIEWLALTKGISEAREKYNILANQRPYCKELHATMSKLESTEIDHDYEVWARVHELACRQFGEDDVDVWINHILFYLHFYKSDDVNQKVQRIYSEAENTLSPLLQEDFKEKYRKALSEQ